LPPTTRTAHEGRSRLNAEEKSGERRGGKSSRLLHLHISANAAEEKGPVGITLLTAGLQELPEDVLLGAINPGADAPGGMVRRRGSLPWKLGQCEDIKGMVGLFMEEMHPKPLHRFIGVMARLQPLLGEGQASGQGMDTSDDRAVGHP
jgi:hypothetical protein